MKTRTVLPCFVLLNLLNLGFCFSLWKRDLGSHETEDYGTKPLVFLTVSSVASSGNNEYRMLELNWDNVPRGGADNDWVKLYDEDPVFNSSNPLESVRPLSDGYYRTTVRFPEQRFSRNNLTDTCLGYWIAYERQSEILSSNCIRARPNWMYKSRSVIGNFSLIDLMIPGTHNAGSFASLRKKEDAILDVFYRYLITQEEHIWNQLVFGIRYLDLRVAYVSTANPSNRLRITHSSFVTDTSIRSVIEQVKEFLESTNEIVIMDFHRFVKGFRGRAAPQRHTELVRLLEEELGNYMIPVSFTSWVDLNTLWSTNKRLYVGYADESGRRQSSLLFPAIKHLWGDVDTVENLRSYLNQTICRQRNRLTSAMAQLTPTTSGVIFNVYGGLRNMGDLVNRALTKWVRDEWSHCANIVATDFFLGNNIIEVSIETNKKKVLM